MIPDHYRFWAQSGEMIPGKSDTWHIIDWDARRYISVTGPEDFAPDNEDPAVEALRPIIDDLDLNVKKVTVDAHGKVLSRSTLSEDDCTRFVLYPKFTEAEAGKEYLDYWRRSSLREVDRLHVCVDLVCHTEQKNPKNYWRSNMQCYLNASMRFGKKLS
jgi:hypothetical protein